MISSTQLVTHSRVGIDTSIVCTFSLPTNIPGSAVRVEMKMSVSWSLHTLISLTMIYYILVCNELTEKQC